MIARPIYRLHRVQWLPRGLHETFAFFADLIRRPIVMVAGTVLVGFEGTHAERTLVGPRT